MTAYPFKRNTMRTIEGVLFEVWAVGVLRNELRSADGRITVHASNPNRSTITGALDGAPLSKRYRFESALVRDAIKQMKKGAP